jgi:hypothetical protein
VAKFTNHNIPLPPVTPEVESITLYCPEMVVDSARKIFDFLLKVTRIPTTMSIPSV